MALFSLSDDGDWLDFIGIGSLQLLGDVLALEGDGKRNITILSLENSCLLRERKRIINKEGKNAYHRDRTKRVNLTRQDISEFIML